MISIFNSTTHCKGFVAIKQEKDYKKRPQEKAIRFGSDETPQSALFHTRGKLPVTGTYP